MYIVTVQTKNGIFNYGYSSERVARSKAMTFAMKGCMNYGTVEVEINEIKEFVRKYEKVQVSANS